MTSLASPVAIGPSPGIRPRPVIVRIDGVSKRYPKRRRWVDMLLRPGRREYAAALDRVSLDIREGEILGLLGPNGAGKTTLLKMLSTLVLPDAGAITIAGLNVVQQGAQARRVLAPMAADERSLDWRLSARENLLFYASLHRLRGAGLRARANELLSTVGLSDAGSKMVGAFSSGMRQRLLIARALLSRPRVLLLDEPTRSLDPLAARAFREFLRHDVAEGERCTILLATHDPEEALELSDRIAILDRGRVLAVGAPTDLAARQGDARYHIWTRDPAHPAFRRVGAVLADVEARADGEGEWFVIELEIPGDDAACAMLSELVRGGASIARFERLRLSLPDLIRHAIDEPIGAPHA